MVGSPLSCLDEAVDGADEEAADFRESADAVGKVDGFEFAEEEIEKVVEGHGVGLLGEALEGFVLDALVIEDAVVANVGAAVALVAEGDSAAQLAGGEKVGTEVDGFGLGHGCSPLSSVSVRMEMQVLRLRSLRSLRSG